MGGDAEIGAIGHLAQINISVASANTDSISFLFPGSTRTLHLAHVNAKNKKGGRKNHYHYGLANVFYNKYAQQQDSTAFPKGKGKFEKSGKLLERKEQKKDEFDISRLGNQEVVFQEGSLKRAIFDSVPLMLVLNSSDEAVLSEAKKQLARIVVQFKAAKEHYGKILAESKKIDVKIIIILDTASGKTKAGSLKDFQVACKNLQVESRVYLNDILNKGAQLLEARQYKRAEDEFQIGLDYSRQINGFDHLETLKIQLNYAITRCKEMAAEADLLLFKTTIQKLEQKLAETEESSKSEYNVSVTIKRALAIGYYNLAHHYFSDKQFVMAAQSCKKSEQLRKEYGASEEELDRVRFFNAKIAYQNGDTDEALKLFLKCYAFRGGRKGRIANLMPVLDHLIDIMRRKNQFSAELIYLGHLLEIKKHLNLDGREIINTQLKILEIMWYVTSHAEYFSVMAEVRNRLDAIPVTKESFEVGENYKSLVKARMAVPLPQEWSNMQKKKYHSETLGIIHKATLHLKTAVSKIVIADDEKELNELKTHCQRMVTIFEDLEPRLRGQPMHPEDAAEMALLVSTDVDENANESSTLEYLAKLSIYSSEIDPMEVAGTDRVLTVAEFEELPDEGVINPYRLRTAQGGINSTFRDGYILSILASDVELEPWKLYVEKLSESTFEYRAIDPRGKPQNGIITERDMPDIKLVLKEPFTLANLKPVLSKIIKITSRRGHTTEEGRPLEAMRDSLIADPKYRVKIPPVEIGIHDGKVYSFDTRRLIVHMMAREQNPTVLVRYRKISGAYLQKRIYDDKIYSARPWNGFVTAIRYGGVNSPSEAYINPAVRKQLAEKVGKTFKSFPGDRKLEVTNAKDDENGFPIVQKQAQKIHNFLEGRAKKGSKRSAKVLKEAKKIGDTQGRYAVFDHLLKTKASVISGQNLEGRTVSAEADGKAPSALGFTNKKGAVSTAVAEERDAIVDDIGILSSHGASLKDKDDTSDFSQDDDERISDSFEDAEDEFSTVEIRATGQSLKKDAITSASKKGSLDSAAIRSAAAGRLAAGSAATAGAGIASIAAAVPRTNTGAAPSLPGLIRGIQFENDPGAPPNRMIGRHK
jgi:hypothetical protein